MEFMKQNWTQTRRSFLIKFGGGLGVLFGASLVGCGPVRRKAAERLDGLLQPYSSDTSPDVWFEITPENKIILKSPKVEMGQGLFTGLAMIAAEELQVNYEQIEVIHASTKNGPLPNYTGGSDSTFGLWNILRELSANMRQMLLNNAAELLSVPVNQLAAKDGIISGNGKQISYGEIAAKAIKWEAPKKTPKLKPTSAFKVIGKEVPRKDLLPKVTGAPIYGFDANLPGMLYGMVVRKSTVDSEFVGADVSRAETIPGVVKIIQEEDFVGVVATSKTAAINAHAAIDAKWNVNKIWQQAEIEEKIKVGKGKEYVIQKEGSAKSILDNDKGVLRFEYTSPIGAHAQLEPNGALADYKDGKVDIYISTQVAKITQDEVAKRLDIDSENVNVITTFLGGGFGRRLHTPNAMQAAVLSKAVGKPVHCFFSRKEEFQNDMFRPPTHHVMRAKLSSDGLIEALEHNVSSGAVAFGSPFIPSFAEPVLGADFGAWRGGLINYDKIPNYRAVSWKVELPFATSWWRGLGLLANSFAIESFMDELAVAAKKDPIEFRLSQIKNEGESSRLIKVIEAARDKSGWGKALPEGHFHGFACSTDAQTPVAEVVELSVEDGEVKIHKVTCAIDPGIAINPDGIRAQCEGAIIMGISAAMFEKMTIKDSVIEQTIFGPYRMALMRNAPKEINVVILENSDKPTGVGEPPIGPIGAAIANAVFAATGKRLRNLPLAEEMSKV
jgi:isoquinoline 1-oxidoreductase beta subunit